MVARGVVSSLLAAGAKELNAVPIRTFALMAILGILLLGMLLIVGTMLGAHWVRRLGSVRRGPVVPPDVSPLPGRVSHGPRDADADYPDLNGLPEETPPG